MKKIFLLSFILGVFLIGCSKDDYPVELTGIQFVEDTVQINYMARKKLSVLPIPSDSELPEIIFETNNRYVAHVVDHTGDVTGTKAGQTTITATTSDGEFSTTCRVVVNPTDFLYQEPYLNFGCNKEEVIANEERGYAGDVEVDPDEGLMVSVFWGANDYVNQVHYWFRDGKLIEVDLYLYNSQVMENRLIGFIEQRYYYLGRYYYSGRTIETIPGYENETAWVGIIAEEDDSDLRVAYLPSSVAPLRSASPLQTEMVNGKYQLLKR